MLGQTGRMCWQILAEKCEVLTLAAPCQDHETGHQWVSYLQWPVSALQSLRCSRQTPTQGMYPLATGAAQESNCMHANLGCVEITHVTSVYRNITETALVAKQIDGLTCFLSQL
jgi:hypothetical protein